MAKKELYGICGLKGHGKDTFANLITSIDKKYQIYHFADSLKEMTAKIFGLDLNTMYDPSKKEIDFKNPIFMDEYIEPLRSETGLNVEKAECIANNPRELMQYIGTEYIRKQDPNFWTNRLFRTIKNKSHVIISDLRFPNEANRIIENNGKIIKILRIDSKETSDKHASETELEKIEADLIIGCVTGDLSLPKKIAHLISIGKFDSALSYDYRKIKKTIESYSTGLSAEKSNQLLGFNGKDPYALYNILDYYKVKNRKRKNNKKKHKNIKGVVNKNCGKCKKWLPLEEYNLTSKNWDGLYGFCRECQSIESKKRYEKYQKIDSLKLIFQTCRKKARYRNIEFSISYEDIQKIWSKQNGKCFYSGENMSQIIGGTNKATIDRIDSDKGYTKDNIVLCSYRANIMKSDLSIKEFSNLIDKIFWNRKNWKNV